jgi:predicted aconitase with swiveling domain
VSVLATGRAVCVSCKISFVGGVDENVSVIFNTLLVPLTSVRSVFVITSYSVK